MQTTRQDVETSHGTITAEFTHGNGPDVVFIHGNSSCRRVFKEQLSSGLFGNNRLICFDLPGHGESADASDKCRTYPLPGLAEASVELLERLGARQPVIVGWSLGGHVAIEMLARSYPASGLLITGTPPVGPDISEGFRGNLLGGLASQGRMTKQEAAMFVAKVFGSAAEPDLEAAAARTDEAFRRTLFSATRREEKSDQRQVMNSTATLTAVVNGEDDQIVNLDYVDGVPFSNLWRNTCYRIPRAGHAAFLQAPDAFNRLLAEFLSDVADVAPGWAPEGRSRS